MSIKILAGILIENVNMILSIYKKSPGNSQNHTEENKVGKFALPKIKISYKLTILK